MDSRDPLFTARDNEAMQIAFTHYIKSFEIITSSTSPFPDFNAVVAACKHIKEAMLCLFRAVDLHDNEIVRQQVAIRNYQLFLNQQNKPLFGIFKPKVTAETIAIADKMLEAKKTIDNEKFIRNRLAKGGFTGVNLSPELKALIGKIMINSFNYHSEGSEGSERSRHETYNVEFKDGTKIEFHDLSEKTLQKAKQEYDTKVESLIRAQSTICNRV